MMKKLLLCVLAVLLCLPCLVCCSRAETVMSYGGYEITSSQYLYWMSYYKTSFLNSCIEYGVLLREDYGDNFWSLSTGDSTYGELTKLRSEQFMMQLLVAQKLCDELALITTDAQRAEIAAKIDEIIDEDIAAAGSRSSLNKMLSAYKLNINGLRALYEMEIKKQLVDDCLYAAGGTEAVNDDDREAYYLANFVRVKHVLVNTVDKYVLNEDGVKFIDPATGYYKVEELTAQELEQKKADAAYVYEQASGGADFEELIQRYNEDEGMTYYTDGYYLTASSSYEENFLTAALEMSEGEVRTVQSEYGIHIIKKYPLPAAAYKTEVNENFFADLDALTLAEKKRVKYEGYYTQITNTAEQDILTCPLMPDAMLA